MRRSIALTLTLTLALTVAGAVAPAEARPPLHNARVYAGTTSQGLPAVFVVVLSPRKRHSRSSNPTSMTTLTIWTIRARVLLGFCVLICGELLSMFSGDDVEAPAAVFGNSLETCSSITHLSTH